MIEIQLKLLMEEFLATLVVIVIAIVVLEKNLFRIIYKKYEVDYGTTIFGISILSSSQIKKIPLEVRQEIYKTSSYKFYSILRIIRIVLLSLGLIFAIIYSAYIKK
ncbi:MAG: hypothetical protein IPH32_08870 [Bacteroidetes bacterium]|nr:hypothetical protein [Bacteroidota bacterium]